MRKLFSLLIIASLMSGCANDPNQKQNIGTVLGGASGALLGATLGRGDGQLVAVAVGAVAGAFIGNRIGASMDKTDALALESNAQKSLEQVPVGQTTTWNNPDTGNHGSFTPTKTYKSESGYCREFTQKITVAGKTQDGYGTACRQPDGSWKIVQ